MLMIINFAVTSFTWGVWVWEGEIHLQTFSASLDSSYVIVLVLRHIYELNKERMAITVHYSNSHNFAQAPLLKEQRTTFIG